MKNIAKPQFVYELWCLGLGDSYAANDEDYPVSPLKRLFWKVRGWVLVRAFSWWHWE